MKACPCFLKVPFGRTWHDRSTPNLSSNITRIQNSPPRFVATILAE